MSIFSSFGNNAQTLLTQAAQGGAFGSKVQSIAGMALPPPPVDRGLATPIQAAPTPSPATVGPPTVPWYQNRKIQIGAGIAAALGLFLLLRRK